MAPKEICKKLNEIRHVYAHLKPFSVIFATYISTKEKRKRVIVSQHVCKHSSKLY